MKNPLRSILFLTAVFSVFLGCVAFFVTSAHAQAAPAPASSDQLSAISSPPTVVTTAENFATPFLVSFAQTHAWLATVIAILGALRLVAKPIMTCVEIYVKNSPSAADDATLEKVEHSFAAKVFYWLLDFGASIKAGSQAAPRPSAPPSAPQS